MFGEDSELYSGEEKSTVVVDPGHEHKLRRGLQRLQI